MDSSSESSHNAYMKARQIESDNHLPSGSVKPEASGRYSLIFVHMSEDQIKQLSHLWYVITQTQHLSEGHDQPGQRQSLR
jgi:hypothetical protein